jgi:hypothetical protein
MFWMDRAVNLLKSNWASSHPVVEEENKNNVGRREGEKSV